MWVVRYPRHTSMLPVLKQIQTRMATPMIIDPSEQATATPHKLGKWCKQLVTEVEPALIKLRCQTPGEKNFTILECYPELEDFLNEAKEGCHLCCMFLGALCDPKNDLLVPKHPIEDCGDSIYAKIDYSKNKDQGDECYISLGKIGAKSRDFDTFVNDLDFVPRNTIQKSFNDAQASRYTGSAACYHMIRDWMHTCAAQHQTCNQNTQIQMPTRILELEFGDTINVKLVPGKSIAAPYATLSYCWGTVDQLMLLRTNYAEFMSHVPFDRLSPVAQDAIKVCRSLSIEYLWIDALCIIQGPDGDFNQEAPRMNDVYGGSTINITAATSTDSTQNFLCHRDPLLYMNCNLDNVHVNNSQATLTSRYVCRGKNTRNRPGDYHIDTRAWFYQERFLSPRSVYFGPKGIHWECRAGIACESQGNICTDDGHYKKEVGHLNHTAWNLKSKFAEVLGLDGLLAGPKAATAIRKIWWLILESYGIMQLTNTTERLAAIAGIAAMFENKFGLHATFGLWIEFLDEELLWQANPNTRQYAEINWQAPSWSWANLETCSVRPGLTLKLGERYGRITCRKVTTAPITRIPSQDGFPRLSETYDKLAFLSIKGRLAHCKVVRRPTPTPGIMDDESRFMLVLKEDAASQATDEAIGNGSKTFELDVTWEWEADDLDHVFCLLIRSELRFVSDEGKPNDHRMDYFGLVLAPVQRILGHPLANGTDSCFVRLGVYEESCDDFQQGDTHYDPENPSQPETEYLWRHAGEEQDVIIV